MTVIVSFSFCNFSPNNHNSTLFQIFFAAKLYSCLWLVFWKINLLKMFLVHHKVSYIWQISVSLLTLTLKTPPVFHLKALSEQILCCCFVLFFENFYFEFRLTFQCEKTSVRNVNCLDSCAKLSTEIQHKQFWCKHTCRCCLSLQKKVSNFIFRE